MSGGDGAWSFLSPTDGSWEWITIGTVIWPSNVMLYEDGSPMLAEDGDFLVLEEGSD